MPALPAPCWGGSWPTKHSAPSGAGLSRKGTDMVTLARCLIAFFFVASGAGKIFAFRPSSTILASIGFPIPTFFLTAIIAVEIAGGLGLLFNLMERKKFFLGLMALAVNAKFNYPQYFVMIPTGPHPNLALTEGFSSSASRAGA